MDELPLQPVAPVVESDQKSAMLAVVELESRQGAEMFHFARELGLSEHHAQDCVQETFLRLWAEYRRGTEIANPRAWAYRTLYRVAMDEHRLRRRMFGLVARLTDRPSVRDHGPDPAVADRLTVWAEVARLPPRQRQVVYLRFHADLPYDSIADVLGISAGAARAHASFGLATIRQRLEPDTRPGRSGL